VSEQERLGAAARNAWGRAYSVDQEQRTVCTSLHAMGVNPLEEQGDMSVRAAAAYEMWAVVVEAGSVTGNWASAIRDAQQLGLQTLQRPLPNSQIGAAYATVRAAAVQEVMLEMDRMLAEHGLADTPAPGHAAD
jgi:hypothetical protein